MLLDYEKELTYSVNSLISIINQCRTKPMFKAGIYIRKPLERITCADLICEFLEVFNLSQEIHRIRRYNSTCEVRFRNGSIIHIPMPGDGARGYRFCSVIIGECMDADIIRNVIFPKLIPYEHFTPLDEEGIQAVYYGIR